MMTTLLDSQVELLADAFQALANPHRLRILYRLMERPHCVCELAEVLGLKKALTSKYLAQLQEAGLVRSSKSGVTVTYQITAPCVLNMCDCTLEALVKTKLERIERASGNKAELPSI